MPIIHHPEFRSFTLALLSFIIAPAFPVSAQQIARSSMISTLEAELAKAAALTDIRSPSSLPFVLVADVHFKFGKQSVDGKYGLSWASPDMYHEVVVFPGFRQDVVVSHDRIYRKRTSDFLPLPAYEWQLLLSAPFLRTPDKNMRLAVARPPKEWRGHSEIDCSAASRELTDMRLLSVNLTYRTVACFDRTHGYPVSSDIDDRGTHISYRFSDYLPLGEQRFPGKITYEHEDLAAEMDVETLKPVQAFAAAEFAPPAGVSPEAWCSKPKISSTTTTTGGNQSLDPGQGSLPDGPIFLYVHVNPKGLVDEAGALQSANPEAANLFINMIHAAVFPIATCNGTPISREFVLSMWPR